MKKNTIFALLVLAFCISACKSKTETGNETKTYATYQDACRNGDFEAALAFVDMYEQEAAKTNHHPQAYITENVERYTSARDFVFNAEAQMLLADGSPEASDRVVFLLNSLPIKGKKLPDGNTVSFISIDIRDGTGFNKDFAWYCESIFSFNEKCRQIMELCVSQKNKYLAEKIVKLVKKRPVANEKDFYTFQISYTDDDINEVKKMFDDAVASGDFD